MYNVTDQRLTKEKKNRNTMNKFFLLSNINKNIERQKTNAKQISC